MAGWHHRLNGHEFEQTLGDSEGQGSLVYCSPWGHKESDMTSRLNNNNTCTVSCCAGQTHMIFMSLPLETHGESSLVSCEFHPMYLFPLLILVCILALQ